MGSLVLRKRTREVAMGRETEGTGERKSVNTHRERKCRLRERGDQKCPDWIGKSFFGRGISKVLSRGPSVPALPCNR